MDLFQPSFTIFAQFFTELNCPAILLDTRFSITAVNHEFEKALGMSEADLLGKDFLDIFLQPADRERIRRIITESCMIHTNLRPQCQLQTAFGPTMELSFCLTPIRDADGNLVGLGLMGQELIGPATEYLKEEQIRLTSILDTSLDGIVLIDDSGLILSFNKTAETQFGYLFEEVLGKNVSMLMPSPFNEHHDEFINNYLRTGQAKIIGKGREVQGRRKDGSIFPLYLSVGREIQIGDKRCFTGFVRDLSREKGIESKLRQAQKMESIGTLAGGIAHDFNNILGGIMGYVDLMLEDAEQGSFLQDDLLEMRNACNRGKDLILQILTFSRQDKSQKLPIAFQPIIDEALKLLRAIIPSSIEIRAQIEGQIPMVLADATQIHQIMMNLCTNAFHAMRGEANFIEIGLNLIALDATYTGTQPNLPFGNYVVIQVRDNGSGMDEATIARIFDPFFTTKGQGKGTGMGLAVVHGIIENHGGGITVESQPGHGSCFRLFFPALQESAEEEVESYTKDQLKGQERIMLVDDDKLLLKVQSRILSKRGYMVTCFSNGQEALIQFRENPDRFDLVITDQTMPKLTGMELAREMIKIREDLPIIITTGFSDAITPDALASRGIRELLRKPVDSSELTSAIRRALDQAER